MQGLLQEISDFPLPTTASQISHQALSNRRTEVPGVFQYRTKKFDKISINPLPVTDKGFPEAVSCRCDNRGIGGRKWKDIISWLGNRRRLRWRKKAWPTSKIEGASVRSSPCRLIKERV